jgi:hypothetical protein
MLSHIALIAGGLGYEFYLVRLEFCLASLSLEGSVSELLSVSKFFHGRDLCLQWNNVRVSIFGFSLNPFIEPIDFPKLTQALHHQD